MEISIKTIVSTIVCLFLAILLICSAYIVDEGERAVITRFGSIERVSEPGFNIKMPFFESVHTYNMRVQKITFGADLGYEHNRNADEETQQPILSAYTYDRQLITSYRISLTYMYANDKIEDVYKYFGTNNSILSTVIYPNVQQVTKNIFGQFTAQTIVQNRTELENDINSSLQTALAKYPINIIGVQLEDVNFSRNYEEVLENTARKAQEIETAKAELQRIEIESRQKIAQADAENQAIKLKADADAYQISVKAKAEADAIKLKAEALRANKELVDLTIAEKWNGDVPTTVLGNSNIVPLFNITDKN